MSSPLNDPALTDWFRRFDAAARHLPAEDRAAQQEELRQHLDALIAANGALGQSAEAAQQNALTRLGDPSQIGRKIDREWQQSRTGFRADMRAIGLGLSFTVACYCMTRLLYIFWLNKHLSLHSNGHQAYGIYRSGHQAYHLYTNGHHWVGLSLAVYEIYVFATLTLIYSVVGRKYPYQSIRSAFFTQTIAFCYWFWVRCFDAISQHNPYRNSYYADTGFTMLQTLCGLIAAIAIAYLASVTRRGWYQPTLSDFKLRLPRRRAVSRG